MPAFTATYSPEDNKLRLYATSRLDPDLYARAKAAGFSWAPRQHLFVAPMWTPEREDLLIELAGTIDDEDIRGGLAYYEKMGFRTYRTLEAVKLQDGRPVDRILKRYLVGR